MTKEGAQGELHCSSLVDITLTTYTGLEARLEPFTNLFELEQTVRSLRTTVIDETNSLRSAVLGGRIEVRQLHSSLNSALAASQIALLDELRKLNDKTCPHHDNTASSELDRTREELSSTMH